jgi:hypothetical protein
LRIEREGFVHVLWRRVTIAANSSRIQMAVLVRQNLDYGICNLHCDVKISFLLRRNDIGK